MKILVDADACPVKEIIVSIAKELQIPVSMFIDTSHILEDGYSKVITVDKGADSVDFYLVNQAQKGDIVVTQDYGLASMALAKGAAAIHQNGFTYNTQNIDGLLLRRHLEKKLRQQKKHTSHMKKRNHENDLAFAEAFRRLCIQLLSSPF